MVASLNDLLSSTLSAGSRKLYSRAWSIFRDFHNRFVSSRSLTLPLNTATIALFISYLRARKLAASTITTYLSAISYVHKMRGFCDPTKTFLIHKLLIAVGKERSPDTRLPITKPVLFQIVRSLQHTNSSADQRTLFTAMFLIAFYGFFRIGELASKSPANTNTVVQFSSLSFLSRDGCTQSLKITICHFKHNTNNRPVDIIITRDPTSPFCPVQAMLDYCKVRLFSPGPLFRLHNRPVTVTQFNSQLRSCLSFCSLDSSRYKSHSFRIGAACHAADLGFSDSQIRALGRWKSDAFKLYIQNETLTAN